ncbi:MAG: tetratricopeptide protein [Bacteroidetes bacterium]|nr:tetratricopeptide protein [Bacteroidota bacterium]
MKRFNPLILVCGMLLFVSFASGQHLTSAKLYYSLKQYDKAEASALKAVEKDPDDEEAWYVLGKSRFELKKYPEMIQAFDKAAKLDSAEHKEEINAYRLKVWADSFNEGIKYYNLGRDSSAYLPKAIESFNTALVAMPDSTRTYYVLALAHYGNKQPDEAIKALNKSLEKSVRPEELKLLGQLHTHLARQKADAKDEAGSKQEYLAAIEAYEKLYQLDRMNTDNILILIDLYQLLGMSDKALTLTRDAVAFDPENRAFRYIYGVFFIKQEKYAEGIEQLNKAVEGVTDSSDQMFSDAITNFGVAYLNWGVALKKESEAKAEEAAKAKKKNYKEDLSYKEKFKAAVPYFERATQLNPKDASAWQQLAKLYANLNMSDKATAAFKKFDDLNK